MADLAPVSYLDLWTSSRALLERSNELCASASSSRPSLMYSARTVEPSIGRHATASTSAVPMPADHVTPHLRVLAPSRMDLSSASAPPPNCSGYACSSPARYRVCVAASVGSGEVAVEQLDLPVCEEHRSDYSLAIRDRRVVAHFRRTFSRRAGSTVKIRSLRVFFVPIDDDTDRTPADRTLTDQSR